MVDRLWSDNNGSVMMSVMMSEVGDSGSSNCGGDCGANSGIDDAGSDGVDDLLLGDFPDGVVLPLNRDGDLDDILNDLLHNLLDGVGDLNVLDLFDWNPDDFNDRVGNVIGHFDALLDDAVHLVRDGAVHDLLHCVWDLDLNWVGSGDWGGDWNVSGDDLLDDLLHGIGDRLVDQSGNRDGHLNGHLDDDLPGNLDNLFYDLFHWVWNLALDDVLDRVRHLAFDNLFNWNRHLNGYWDRHSAGDLDNLLNNLLNRVGSIALNNLLNGNWNLNIADVLHCVRYVPLNNLFHWNWNFHSVRNGDIIVLGEGAVNDFLDGVRHATLNNLLNWVWNWSLNDSLNWVWNPDFLWDSDFVGAVHTSLDNSVDGERHLCDDLSLDWYGFGSVEDFGDRIGYCNFLTDDLLGSNNEFLSNSGCDVHLLADILGHCGRNCVCGCSLDDWTAVMSSVNDAIGGIEGEG